MHLQIGTLLNRGKYRIIRYISSGGFGCTYEALNVEMDCNVAIKEFYMKDFCNRDSVSGHVTVATQSKVELVGRVRRKFVEEAQALYRMNHPNIVRVTDKFEENGTAYYVMDYVEGNSLAGLISDRGPLPEDEAVWYIRQTADALEYVHSLNRLHLDVKPHNIMIDNSGKVVLIDFGVSKQYDEVANENTSTLMGSTPGYAPPEQMSRSVGRFTPATDIYALGATLYKLLTGITPVDASLRSSGEELEPLPVAISATVRHAVEASMQMNKNKRPQSIGEFVRLVESGMLRDESNGRTIIALGNSSTPGGEVSRSDGGECHSADTVISNGSEKSHSADNEILSSYSRQNSKSANGHQNDKDGNEAGKKSLWIILLLLLIAGVGAWFVFSGTIGDNSAEEAVKEKVVEVAVDMKNPDYEPVAPVKADVKSPVKAKQPESTPPPPEKLITDNDVKTNIVDSVKNKKSEQKPVQSAVSTPDSNKIFGASNNMTPSSDFSDNELIQMAQDGNDKSTGSAEGNVEFSLAGRKGVSLPTERVTVKGNCTVVVRIEVDPNGNVVDATRARGTDTSDPSALNAALRFAKKSKFSKTTGSENQYGTITYKFKVL